ncbi:MAG: winged helix-turn-helix domain-containing protein, partial [Alphaproteobacteria bacterium]|nr:winged helix-turn-helix domain-containing protein [Alphaproteobacteria bacterium]
MEAIDQVPGLQGQSRRLVLSLLGAFSLTAGDGTPVAISGKKSRALIAILALTPGQSISRERLCTLLWGDHADELARNNLRQTLSVLRKELGPDDANIVRSQGDRLVLDTGLVSVDALDVIAAADDEDPVRLRKVAQHLTGSLLPDATGLDEPFEEWLTLERQRLHNAAVRILERLAEVET